MPQKTKLIFVEVWYPRQVYYGENVSKGNGDTITVSDEHSIYLHTVQSTMHRKYPQSPIW